MDLEAQMLNINKLPKIKLEDIAEERTEKAKNVTGRGHTDDGVVISEYAAPTNNDMDQLLILSGIKSQA